MSADARSGPGPNKSKKPGLLLVEDDQLQRFAMSAALSDAGFAVVACGSGSEAEAAFERFRPAVAVIDLVLPDTDGVALIERLRALDAHLGVLIVTVHPAVRAAVSAMRSGAADFLVKPVANNRLIASVKAALKRREADLANEAFEKQHTQLLHQMQADKREWMAFSAQLTHDLRSPMRAASLWVGFAQEALSQGLWHEAEQHLSAVHRSIDSSLCLIDGLMSLSKAHVLPLQVAPLSLQTMLAGVIERCRFEFPNQKHELEVDVSGTLVADPVLTSIALYNAVQNAFKYSSQQAHPKVGIHAHPLASSGYEIRVADNGIGAPSAEVPRLFQAFERLTSAHRFAGEGIGLTTIKRIMDKHGGQASIETQEGQGFTLSLTFPSPTRAAADGPDADAQGHRPPV